MRVSRPIPVLAVVLATVVCVPAARAAGDWGAPVSLGVAAGAPVSVAVGPHGEVGVLRVHGDGRVGTPAFVSFARRAADGTFPVAQALAFAEQLTDATLTFDRTGRALAAWQRYDTPAAPTPGRLRRRLQAVRIDGRVTIRDLRDLTDGAQVYQPTWVPGVARPTLGWGETSGPIRIARWGASADPERLDVPLPVKGIRGAAGGGAPGGRVITTWKVAAGVMVARSDDDGAHYERPVLVSRKTPVALFPRIAVGAGGGAVIAWPTRRRSGDGALYGVVIDADGSRPGPARRLAGGDRSVSEASMVAAPDGGGFAAWAEEVDGPLLKEQPTTPPTSRIRVARLPAGGGPPAVTDLGPALVGSPVKLLPYGDRGGALALWTTPGRRLRARTVRPAGRAGAAVTLGRGIVGAFSAAAGGGGRIAVVYSSGARLLVRVRG